MLQLNQSKKIWFINQYGSLPNTGIAGRPRHLSRELANLGHKVTLVSARWTHNTRDAEAAYSAPEIELFEGFRFLRIPVIKYKHAHDKKRIVNWFYFSARMLCIRKKILEKPDVIIYSSPSLIGFLSAYILSKKYNAKLIFEVRDIWPLTPIKLGGFSNRNPFMIFLQWIEDFAYKKSDYLISNLEGVYHHINDRGIKNDNFYWIPNGISLNDIDTSKSASKEILESIKEQPFSLTYVGSIGLANSLDTLLDAVNLIKQNSFIHVNIFGDGDFVEDLKSKSKSLGLNNVHFWNQVPKNQIYSILKVSDACVICWKKAFLYKYGVAANKIFDYLLSGKPIISAFSGEYDLINRYEAGITVPAEDPYLLSEAILNLMNLSEKERIEIGKRGINAVKEHHEYKNISKKLNCIICEESIDK